jgi:squalene-hopene/tetraprenyl-beta-curcumene cyclase
MRLIPRRPRHALALVVVLFACPVAKADDERSAWNAQAASAYMDERATGWFAFDGRGEGATRSTCISCHTLLPYLLARPVLRRAVGTTTPTEQETKLLAQTRMRVQNWPKLDAKAFGLFYDDSDLKKKQSWGTEAVFNALILALDDRDQGRSSPGEITKQALGNLWQTQVKSGDQQGSWEWLDFGEPPWGSSDARYFGAALAAIAVGTAPGYYRSEAGDRDAGVELLRDYLRKGLPRQNLHHQAWALWAASTVDGLLTEVQQRQISEQLLKQQRDDGGWSLSSLGSWVRNDGTAQEALSDGYATGLVLHVLQLAGVPKSDVKVAKGLDWLRLNQTATGAWRGISVTKRRDPNTHVGKFMSDAATAFAVLAMSVQ